MRKNMKTNFTDIFVRSAPADIRLYAARRWPFGSDLWSNLRQDLKDFDETVSGDGKPVEKEQAVHHVVEQAVVVTKAKYGTVTSEAYYRKPLLAVLYSSPGHGTHASEAVDRVLGIVKKDLKPLDLQKTGKTGVVRAENKINFARNSLCDEGLIERGVRGYWKLTPKGVAEGQKAAKEMSKHHPAAFATAVTK